MGYFDNDPSEYEFRAFDIETTGFGAHDTLTTFTLEDDGVYHIWVNTQEREFNVSEATETVTTESDEDVMLYAAQDGGEMLQSIRQYIEDHFNSKSVLVAYNGERWNGGFDVPFLRTACLNNGVEWVFNDVLYMDIHPVFDKKNRFNTTVPSHDGLKKSDMQEFADWVDAEYEDGMTKSELSDMIMDTHYDFQIVHDWVDETGRDEVPTYDYGDQVGVYRAIFSESHEYDPWADSAMAVTAFENGDFTPLILHNLADVVKTTELTDLIVEYISQDDLSLKTL